jgi:hypothetical protein
VNAHELTMADNYVVKTALKVGADWLRPLVEQVVRLRSEVEAHGNLVFTLTLLKRAESKQPITAEFVSQGFIGACMRAVTVRRADQRKPDVVEFTHTVVLPDLRAAQQTVIRSMTAFHNSKGLTETLNAAARRYRTVLVTNVCLRIEGWQKSTLRLQLRAADAADGAKPCTKVLETFRVRALQRHINRAKLLDPAAYKSPSIQVWTLQADRACLAVLRVHQQELLPTALRAPQPAGNVGGYDPLHKGILHEKLVTKDPHLYLDYGLALQRQYEALRVEEHKEKQDHKEHKEHKEKQDRKEYKKDSVDRPRPRAPFLVLPQLGVKLRSMTFGQEQMAEFATVFVAPHAKAPELLGDIALPTLIQRTACVTERLQQAVRVSVEEEAKEKSRYAALTPAKRMRQQDSHTRRVQRLQAQRAKKVVKITKAQAVAKRRELAAAKTAGVAVQRKKKRKRSTSKADTVPALPLSTCKRQKVRAVPRSTWLRALDDHAVARKLFAVPKHLAKRWTGSVTTDGVVACWHLVRPPPAVPNAGPASLHTPSTRSSGKGRAAARPTRLVPGTHYGHHLRDVRFDAVAQPFGVVAVDPGHVDLIAAARVHTVHTVPTGSDTAEAEHAPQGTSSRQRARARKLAGRHRTEFRLSNRQWQHVTGQLTRRAREEALQHKLPEYLPAVAQLAQHSARTASPSLYADHARARVATATALNTRNHTRSPRRWA